MVELSEESTLSESEQEAVNHLLGSRILHENLKSCYASIMVLMLKKIDGGRFRFTPGEIDALIDKPGDIALGTHQSKEGWVELFLVDAEGIKKHMAEGAQVYGDGR